MTRADVGSSLETGVAEIEDGDAVIVASDGLRDFADPLGQGSGATLAVLRNAADAASAPCGLIELACTGGAGDNVAVAVASTDRGKGSGAPIRGSHDRRL